MQELWALALSTARWIRLIKHGLNPADLFRQDQPAGAGVGLNLLARLSAGSLDLAEGLWWAGGKHAVLKPVLEADQAKQT